MAVLGRVPKDFYPWKLVLQHRAERESVVGESSAGSNLPASPLHRFSLSQLSRRADNRAIARDIPNTFGAKRFHACGMWELALHHQRRRHVIFPKPDSFLPARFLYIARSAQFSAINITNSREVLARCNSAFPGICPKTAVSCCCCPIRSPILQCQSSSPCSAPSI